MLDPLQKQALLQLRLLIARAAQKDSLNWWEDDSLTQAGSYLLERLFLADPGEAGRKLALAAAKTRYQAAFNGEDSVLHLFRLDMTGEIEYGLQGVRLAGIPLPADPIASLDDLRQDLLEMTGQVPQFKILGERAHHRIEIGLKEPVAKLSVLDIAKTLAWAALEGKPGQPIFPYITTV